MEVQVAKTNETLSFFVTHDKEDKVLFNLPSRYFSKLWSKSQLDQESENFQKKFKTITGTDKDIEYFREFLIKTMESCLHSKLDSIQIDNERLKSFLVYHIRTLRSVKKYMNISKEDGLSYIDNELYNISNIKIDDFFKILDTMTAKRKEKK
jgi:hypothetical protein